MYITCLDLEGVLVPEIWIAFAEASGIPELKRTTRDEPDYNKLMNWRLGILKEHGLGLKEIQETIAKIDPMPGAKEFLDELRSFCQVIIISDTFSQFAGPLMKKLGMPTIFCNTLEVAPNGEITGFKMRCEQSKLTTVKALQSIGFETIASGGAVSTSTLLSEPLFSVKSQMDIGLKDAIAQEAVKYVAPGDVIAIGGGTTAYVFAQHLLESQQSSGITILTNSIPVAELVQALESKDVEVIVTGGVTTRSNSLVGPIADKVVASLRVNTVFLGTHSVSIPRGFLMPNSLEAATDMAMMDIADRTIILTDHTKWSCTSLSLFARFDQVDTVITDDGLDPDSVSKTRDLVKELVLARQAEPVQEGE